MRGVVFRRGLDAVADEVCRRVDVAFAGEHLRACHFAQFVEFLLAVRQKLPEPAACARIFALGACVVAVFSKRRGVAARQDFRPARPDFGGQRNLPRFRRAFCRKSAPVFAYVDFQPRRGLDYPASPKVVDFLDCHRAKPRHFNHHRPECRKGQGGFVLPRIRIRIPPPLSVWGRVFSASGVGCGCIAGVGCVGCGCIAGVGRGCRRL